ncbi:serine/threonine-protein kinase [Streptomyces hoynatensis]|uniref:serine/threonine-protein kinase n=1 Tax=Streptomyces hoynatensis TaxID=1141874 RepID=UPI0019D4D14B|nr:serine/threonine-protein kinase [Streptomyces hoynatensis]
MGHYRLLGKLGAGGMGSVYLARSDRGRTVAVKLVQPELAAQPEFRQRFQHEVDAARRVGGEWTAPVLDCDTEAETPWVATGYVAGPSLHEVVADSYGPLPERTLFVLANGLVKALRDIHAAGLVHRDLKPSNVMITIDGPRVIDFGIARALESGEGLTRTGAAVGSPGFMSPEQCRGETLTAASDIFCLGSVLTFAATGRTPFGDANSAMTALMLRIVQGEQDLEGVPEAVKPLIESCLTQDPTQRPSLDQLLQYTDIPDAGDEPWLPGALVARLGRHAVELLDSEDPLQAPPLPQNAPPPAMPQQPPVTPLPPGASPVPPAPPTPTQLSVPATPPPPQGPGTGVNAMATMTSAVPPPGYGTPPPPGQGGYGFPQQAPGTPAYGYPQDPNAQGAYGPGYPGGPTVVGPPAGPGGPRRNNNTAWIIVAAVAVLALVVGVAVFALGGDSDDEADDPPTSPSSSASPDPSGSASPSQEQSQSAPPQDPSATVPYEFVGAWEGEVSGGAEGANFQRIEISEGGAGATVATQYTVLTQLMCTEQAVLTSATGSSISISGTGVTGTSPSGATCQPYGEQTIQYQTDGSLLWSDGTRTATLQPAALYVDSDGMPLGIYDHTFAAPDFQFTAEYSANAGDLALTYTNGSCTWQSVLIAGGVSETSVLVGPGEVTSGSCDPLPPYRIEWTDPSTTNDVVQMTPFGESSGFQATLSQ